MDVKLPEAIADEIGFEKLTFVDLIETSFSYAKYITLHLPRLTLSEIKQFRELVAPFTHIRGGATLLKDLDTWIEIVEFGRYPKPRNLQHFTSILTQMIAKLDGHRIYEKNDIHGEAWLCYYVSDIEYHPERRERDYKYPEHTTVRLVYEEFGGRKEKTLSFHTEDSLKLHVETALLIKGFCIETPEMREIYLRELKRFLEIIPQIGKQYYARGIATDDLDGNDNKKSNSWWSSRTNRIFLDKDGIPARVVVDVFTESDKETHDRHVHINSCMWDSYKIPEELRKEIKGFTSIKSKERDEARKGSKRLELPIEDTEDDPAVIEIPTHPFCAVFDLKRHLRLRVHVNYLAEYIYDPSLGEKLILPKETHELVQMLVAHKGIFNDIIKNKGNGIVVLCAGKPGTGKTLTAEVYAEVMSKPLYSVQCSQLGLRPEDLEDELLKVFARSQRWNAILLLDEADVYVHRRGDSIQQNAIVGVFLRTLEYYNGVLFLTTNRANDVDDAITSRCVARIEYDTPTIEDQKKIWNVLSKGSNINITNEIIVSISQNHKDLTGRDIKNLLKLGKMVCDAKGIPLTPDIIDFVRKFKPSE